jgi:engulfment/cell motility protein 1
LNTSFLLGRNLRGRLYNECFELVRGQRIDCLVKGAWFMHTPAEQVHSSRDSKRSTLQGVRWRFYRLATNKRMLHYCETNERSTVRPGLLDLPHSIDVTALKDILPSTSRTRTPLSPASNPYSPSTISHSPTLTFGLYGPNGVLAQLTASDANTYAEWIDGLSLLRPNGYIHTKETVRA